MTLRKGQSPSAKVRQQLAHSVVDGDGHTVEYLPALAEYLAEAGSALNLDRRDAQLDRLLPGVMGSAGDGRTWFDQSLDERAATRTIKGPWWGLPARNTLDLATASIPRLLYERLGDIGLDYSVIYGSLGPGFAFIDDERFRRTACRAVNAYHADVFGPYRDRLEPAAVIPMHTPDEAIDELEHSVLQLGLKTVVIAGYVMRPLPHITDPDPNVRPYLHWMDTFGIDSQYDYDRFWQRCADLRVPVASHSGGIGWGSRQSISSYNYNHIGHFAAAGEALCKSLFLGGVTRRFPSLHFAFLEGGVAWACGLYSDLVGHWEKRNLAAVEAYNPAHFNLEEYTALLSQFGGPLSSFPPTGYLGIGWGGEPVREDERDEWAACGISTVEDIARLFVKPFYFGCEADDPMTAMAFDSRVNPLGAHLRAVFSSDIGHWDVPDMNEVLAEAHEAVEDGRLTTDEFREFVFVNPVRFLAGSNPNFFNGTALEAEVRTSQTIWQDRAEGLPSLEPS